jgi:hypothetical protein
LFRRCIKKHDNLCRFEEAVLENAPARKERDNQDMGFDNNYQDTDHGKQSGDDGVAFDSSDGRDNGSWGNFNENPVGDNNGGW